MRIKLIKSVVQIIVRCSPGTNQHPVARVSYHFQGREEVDRLGWKSSFYPFCLDECLEKPMVRYEMTMKINKFIRFKVYFNDELLFYLFF